MPTLEGMLVASPGGILKAFATSQGRWQKCEDSTPWGPEAEEGMPSRAYVPSHSEIALCESRLTTPRVLLVSLHFFQPFPLPRREDVFRHHSL